MAKKRAGDRGEVLLAPEQREGGQPVPRGGSGGEDPPVRIDVLIEFTRALIRNCPNGDLLALSTIEARKRTGATREEMELFTKAVTGEAAQAPWPKGFF